MKNKKDVRIILKSLYDAMFREVREELIRQAKIYNLFVNYYGKIYNVDERGELCLL